MIPLKSQRCATTKPFNTFITRFNIWKMGWHRPQQPHQDGMLTHLALDHQHKPARHK
jgi:hypothetical protein